jgi:hypothetical protein
MSAQELRQSRYQGLAGQGYGRRYPQQSTRSAGEVSHLRKAVCNPFEWRSRFVNETLAGLREAHAASGAANEGHAGGALELRDALTHCRLAHAQPGRGSRKTALLPEHREPVDMGP